MKKHRKKTIKPPMPMEFPTDSVPVRLLIAECRRMNALAEKWIASKPGNIRAADACLANGWAFSLAAAWLRVVERGEVTLPEGWIRNKQRGTLIPPPL
jgi:hypothetical protein